MAQERIQKQKAQVKADTHTEDSNPSVSNEDLKQRTDDVLDKIDDALDEDLLADLDDVLEENAEEFVNNYIQKGGQ